MKVALAVLLSAVVVGSSLARADGPTHPLEKAHAGEWVFHQTTTKDADKKDVNTFRYQWVEKVEDRQVSVKTQAVTPDGHSGLSAPVLSVIDLDKPPYKEEISGTTDEVIQVGDRKVKCTRKEIVTIDTANGKLTTTRWVSNEVPLYGTVRSVTVNKDKEETSRTELVDFGDTGGAERPVAPPEARAERE